jgi:hypothetical protein
MIKPSCYQAISTHYLPPTNVKGSRIKAKAYGGSLTVHLDHALNIEANHAKAAKALAEKLGWQGEWYMGGTFHDCGYCFVQTHITDAATAADRGAVFLTFARKS